MSTGIPNSFDQEYHVSIFIPGISANYDHPRINSCGFPPVSDGESDAFQPREPHLSASETPILALVSRVPSQASTAFPGLAAPRLPHGQEEKRAREAAKEADVHLKRRGDEGPGSVFCSFFTVGKSICQHMSTLPRVLDRFGSVWCSYVLVVLDCTASLRLRC